ncbi:hypothetical protein ASJ33_06200 [Dehalococcoides mccartyi]|uniref:Cardiolipin synthase N-terminal domain-containing protein n=1 Tax=Dehalococcoides mccartyi (strain VS) TaxID=311424 RepID=D2BII1_DEHMV|nr:MULTISPECIES: PLDc N-terminal domain-containing protein [Dehalococcoides]ACZ62131.1 hypothetical protein DhcVS_1014 [Dehalococcoides mccartyi VS]APH12771.1 hypothetical protein ASJ33_06200 [Dehalococcoides mccartyi]QYY57804.1 PLDc N-terminal domain-containing protein [Dehalococcoides mccartyi]
MPKLIILSPAFILWLIFCSTLTVFVVKDAIKRSYRKTYIFFWGVFTFFFPMLGPTIYLIVRK